MTLTPERLKELSDQAIAALKEKRICVTHRESQERRLQEAREKEAEAVREWEKAAAELKAAVDGEAVEEVMES